MPNDLSIKILGDPDQGVIDQFNFYAGETKTLKFQIVDAMTGQKVAIPAAAAGPPLVTHSLILPSSAAVNITLTPTQDTNDPSIFSMDLTPTQTNLLMTGWIEFRYAVAGAIRIAMKQAVIYKRSLPA